MDTTLTYSLLAGFAVVLLFIVARFAMRWIFKLAVVGLLLIALGGAAWIWFNHSPRQSESKPRSTPTRRAGTNQQ
jgi:energy-coupling factor transporter transmembrane protein EcfT